jgi:ubiquinone/menaquinone biosynthesis C-methylase UbiE
MQSKRIEDVGCGNGGMTLRLAAAGHQVTGADPAAAMPAAAADRLAARPELADRVRLVDAGFESLSLCGELFDTCATTVC